jgi:hypothetical protein
LGLDLEPLQQTLATLLQGNGYRALVAPLVLRLDRCSEADQIALQTAFVDGQLSSPSNNGGSGHNLLLNLVATYRELYRVTMEPSTVEELADGLLFDSGAMRAHAHRRTLFPKDFARPLDTVSSGYVGALHIVQGGLDPLAPLHLAEAVVSRWADAVPDLVIIAQGGHASPRFTIRRDGERCSERWLRGFLADPIKAFEGTCLQDIAPLDLGVIQSATQDLSQAFFGVRDAWGK